MKYLSYIIILFQFAINLSFGHTLKYDWPHEVSDLQPDPRIVYGKLENGFRYVFMPNQQLPKHFSVRLYVNAGSLMEEENERGLAHFLEHMAFKGIRGYPEDQMTRTLQDLGVPSGSHINAYTGYDKTVYQLDFMNNTPENLDHALKIMAGIADGMFLDEALIQKEIGVILAEKRDRDDPQNRLNIDSSNFILKGMRINERIPIGLESVIKSANASLLRNFYKKWYRPERMILVIAGDLNQVEVESCIRGYFSTFSDLSPEPAEADLGTLKCESGLKLKIYKDKDLPNTAIELTSLIPLKQKVFNRDSRKEVVYKNMAGKIFYERLNKLADQSNSLFSNPDWSRFIKFNLFTESKVSIECKPEKIMEALTTVEQELRRFFEYGFTTEEFERMKRQTLYNTRNYKNYYENITTNSLIEDLLGHTIDKNIFESPREHFELVKNFLQNEAAREECIKVFRDAWDLENLFIHISTNSDLKYDEAQLKEAYLQSKETYLEAPKQEEFIAYHFNRLDEKGTIADKYYNSYLDCHQYRFSNNVRVNLKQTNYDKNTIFYQINFGNGQDEPETNPNGIIKVASDIMHTGGIGKLSEEQLIRAFSDSGVNIPIINVESDAFIINSSIASEDFERQMNLICGFFMEPAYRSDGLNRMHSKFQNSYSQLNKTIGGTFAFEIDSYLTNGHPDYELEDLNDILARTPDDIKNWISDALTNSYMEISIVGDFNEEEILESLSKTLGALPARRDHKQCHKEKPDISLRDAPIKKVFSYYSELPQAVSLVCWELGKFSNDLFYVPIVTADIISQILRERLWQKIRLELGEGYSPQTYLAFKENAIVATVVTDPEKTNRICELIVKIADTMATEGVTEDEFNKVIKAKLLAIESSKYTNNYWLSRLAYSQEHPHSSVNMNLLDNYYWGVSLEIINLVAKEFLQDNKALQIMIVPDSFRLKVEEMAKNN